LLKNEHMEDQKSELTTDEYVFLGITHIGLVRKSNADRYLIRELADKSILVSVADGLGDGSAGEIASDIIIQKLAGLNSVPGNYIQPILEKLASDLDQTVFSKSQEDMSLAGMGSTLICVLLQNQTAHWVHVGDSRLYLYRNNTLSQVNIDQTLARFLFKEGEITEEQLPTHYSREVMDQYIGCGYAEPETGFFNLLWGDILILSSDGLHGGIADTTMNSILTQETSLEDKAKSLVKAALEAGGDDNITLVIAQIKQ